MCVGVAETGKEMKAMEEKREYDCGKCTNRNTPICDACNYAKSPSGKISRPTMFTESVNISAHMNAALLEAKNRIIINAATSGASIPTDAVLRYNKLIEIEKRKAERK